MLTAASTPILNGTPESQSAITTRSLPALNVSGRAFIRFGIGVAATGTRSDPGKRLDIDGPRGIQ